MIFRANDREFKKAVHINIWLICLFFFGLKGTTWSAVAPPFKTTLTIERIGIDCEGTFLSSVIIGLDESASAICVCPMLPPDCCLATFIDPNYTKSDGYELTSHRDCLKGWYEAVLPFPYQKAIWSVKILYPNAAHTETGSLNLSWDPNELDSLAGRLELTHGATNIRTNMKETSQVELNNVENGQIIEINYFTPTFNVESEIMSDPNIPLNYKVSFIVTPDSDCSINKVWAEVIYPNCPGQECGYYENPNYPNYYYLTFGVDHCVCDGNHCIYTFPFNYTIDYDYGVIAYTPFCLSGTYQVHMYARGENNEKFKPETFFFEIPIPTVDAYEPDDVPGEAREIFLNQSYQHSLHDPNDIDWVKFLAFPGRKYELCFAPGCKLPLDYLDPNEVPFQLTLLSEGEEELHLLDSFSWNKMFYPFIYVWENEKPEPILVHMKISFHKPYQSNFPYSFFIDFRTDSEIGGECTSTGGYVKAAYRKGGIIDKNNRNILKNIYLMTSNNEKCQPLWYYNPMGDPTLEYFVFNKIFNFAFESFSLWVGDRLLDENLNPAIEMIDLNTYFVERQLPSSTVVFQDNDCDGIMDNSGEDTDSSKAEIILHGGMNLFRYPFWAYYRNKSNQRGSNLHTLFYDDNFSDFISEPDHIEGIYIFSDQNNAWFYYNHSSKDIFLPNLKGCLVYSQNDQRISFNGKPGAGAYFPWGNCLHDFFHTDNAPDPQLMVDLTPGLNVIGFTGYQKFFYQDHKLSSAFLPIHDPNFDSFSLVKSLYESEAEPPLYYNPNQSDSDPGSSESEFNESTLTFVPGTVVPGFSEPTFPPLKVIDPSALAYDNKKGKWQQSYVFFGHTCGNRFRLKMNEAYLVYAHEKKDKWLPYSFIP